jgi:hypothetical protein
MATHLELHCIFNLRCKKLHSNNITYDFYVTFVADLQTHGSAPCLFYSSQISVAPMVLILVNTPRVFIKYSEQLAECQLIQPNANNTNIPLIGATLLLSPTNYIISVIEINLKFNQNIRDVWYMGNDRIWITLMLFHIYIDTI